MEGGGYNPTQTGTHSPFSYSPPHVGHDQSTWAPNEVSMSSYSSLPSASVSTSAKKNDGNKGKEAVLSHPKHNWPKKMVKKIACRFCNPTRSLDLEWFTSDGLKNHYEKWHNGYVNASSKKTCKICGNKFNKTEEKKYHQKVCENEGWVMEFEVED